MGKVIVGVVLVCLLALGTWWFAGGCKAKLSSSSGKVSAKVVDGGVWRKLLSENLGCKYGVFWLKENQKQAAKLLPVRTLRISIEDNYQTIRVGQDRNKPDYSFGWEREGLLGMKLGVQAGVIGDKRKFVKAIGVGLVSLRNELGSMETVNKGEDLADRLYSMIVVE